MGACALATLMAEAFQEEVTSCIFEIGNFPEVLLGSRLREFSRGEKGMAKGEGCTMKCIHLQQA